MTDKKEHTTQGGVDWELRAAEDAMVTAPGGSRELALAMRRHADGVRNMMQSELVPSFENAIDRIMEKRVIDVLANVQQSLDTQLEIIQQVLTTARDALTVAKAARRGLGKLEKDVRSLDKRDAAQYKETQRLFQESEGRQRALAAELAAVRADFAGYAAGSKRDEFARRLDELEADRGDYSPEERADLVGTLLRMIAEYKQAHGDGT